MSAPITPGVSPDLIPIRALTRDELGPAIEALAGPLGEAFATRLRLLHGTEVGPAHAAALFALTRTALELPAEPERSAQQLVAQVSQDFASDDGAHEVVLACDAFVWAVRDMLGPRFGTEAAAGVQEAHSMLLGLTQRIVRHRTGEFPTDPHFHRPA